LNEAESLLNTLRGINVGVLGGEAVAGVLVVIPVEEARQADVRFLNAVLFTGRKLLVSIYIGFNALIDASINGLPQKLR